MANKKIFRSDLCPDLAFWNSYGVWYFEVGSHLLNVVNEAILKDLNDQWALYMLEKELLDE